MRSGLGVHSCACRMPADCEIFNILQLAEVDALQQDRGAVRRLHHAMLSNMHVQLSTRSGLTPPLPVARGVPQGAVLSPEVSRASQDPLLRLRAPDRVAAGYVDDIEHYGLETGSQVPCRGPALKYMSRAAARQVRPPLQEKLREEWQQQYVDYKMLKKVLKLEQETAASSCSGHGQCSDRNGSACLLRPPGIGTDEAVHAFMQQQQDDIWKVVCDGVDIIPTNARQNALVSVNMAETIVDSIQNFKSYVELNRTAVRKIIKKFDKRFHVRFHEVISIPDSPNLMIDAMSEADQDLVGRPALLGRGAPSRSCNSEVPLTSPLCGTASWLQERRSACSRPRGCAAAWRLHHGLPKIPRSLACRRLLCSSASRRPARLPRVAPFSPPFGRRLPRSAPTRQRVPDHGGFGGRFGLRPREQHLRPGVHEHGLCLQRNPKAELSSRVVYGSPE
eukprot:s6025_g5.t1